jgi:hypothetical protein
MRTFAAFWMTLESWGGTPTTDWIERWTLSYLVWNAATLSRILRSNRSSFAPIS